MGHFSVKIIAPNGSNLNGNQHYVGSPFMDQALRIQRMDHAGIDYQIISPNPLTYLHFIGSLGAISFCRAHG